MPRTKQRKVGDRIFYKAYDGSIETVLITEIKDTTDSHFDKHGNPLKNGKVFKYKMYKTGQYTWIEDYNCLSENDPRVSEFCKGKKFIAKDFMDELRQFLKDKGCHKGDSSVSQILYSLAEEYE